MAPEANDDPPVVKLVNLILLQMIKKKTRAVRVRADAPQEEWNGETWVEMLDAPAKLRVPMIERLLVMAEIPDDAPIRFDARIRLRVAPHSDFDFDVTYTRSRGGGVVLILLEDTVRDNSGSNGDLMQKALIQLGHAEDALARDDVRARVRDAVARVKEDPGRKWFLRTAARTCMASGLYEDALALLVAARPLNEDDPASLADVEAEIGVTLASANRMKEGEDHLRLALAIAGRPPRPHAFELYPLLQLARLELERENAPAAEAFLARVEAIAESLLGPATAVHLLARPVRVRALRERGDAAGAETLATASLREAEEIGLVSEAEDLREELGEMALARGDTKAAIDHLREVLQLPSRSPMRARTYTTLARAQRATGRDSDAVSSLRAAVALVDGALPHDHPLRIEVERELATLTAAVPYR